MSKLTSQNIVATADVDYDHVLHALVDKSGWISPQKQPLKDAYDKATRYTDYRKMFDTQKDIDAVLIATPDHHHAVAARWAMGAGLPRLRAEAADLQHHGEPQAGGAGGGQPENGHPDGQPGSTPATTDGAVVELIRGGVIWAGARGACLDQPAGVAAGGGETRGRRGAGQPRLGDMARSGERGLGLQPRLRGLQLARLDPVRLRRAG